MTAQSVPVPSTAPATGIAVDELVSRKRLRLDRDASRVIVKMFMPGEYPPENESRAGAVIDRVLRLSETDVDAAYGRTLDGFANRHRRLEGTFLEHFEAVDHRIEAGTEVSEHRKHLIGAHFTHEYSIEGAALTNPSMVAHPDQSGLEPGELRFLMSARAIGEGHLSCIEFRTGVVGRNGELRVDQPVPFAGVGQLRASMYERSLLEAAFGDHKGDDEVLAYLLHYLPERFTGAELEIRLGELHPQLLVLEKTYRTIARIHWFMACQYRLEFPKDSDVSERVLWPVSPTERRGMEDARFVQFTDASGIEGYRATYTAYDGSSTTSQLIETDDFLTFQITQLFGAAVGNKGLALFPRLVNGTHMALSRWDRETTSIATSKDGRVWVDPQPVQVPERDWELMQIGNCGSPIETPEGWLVLTHGVGPMRVYAIGAILLDLENPYRVIGSLDEPLLIASPELRNGYVPNVVYSCGALKHGETLVIPYGFGDMGIEFATVSIPGLLKRLHS